MIAMNEYVEPNIWLR